MPQFLQNALEREAVRKGKKGRAKSRYIYGTMNNIGAMHGNKETDKRAAMDKKHKEHVFRRVTKS